MTSKKCRFCRRFMEFLWVELGSEAASGEGLNEGLVPMFYCPSCRMWDDELIDLKYYDWLLYQDTIDLKEAERELSPSEYLTLLAELYLMEQQFLNRPYRAIPKFV